MKNYTKEKRMLDILDRLANGEISPQKADELLKQADYADENGQGGAADGGGGKAEGFEPALEIGARLARAGEVVARDDVVQTNGFSHQCTPPLRPCS